MKIKIKTNLVTGILTTVLSLVLLAVMPTQVRVPAYDSGAPSPRIIPGICLVVMLLCGIVLIIESLIFKKEKVVEFDWQKEKPAILLILLMCVYVAMIIYLGFIIASAIVFVIVLWYCGERKPFIYIFTVLAAVVIFYLFTKVFYINLPFGPFGG